VTFAYWRKCDFQVHTPRDPNWHGARPLGIGDDNNGSPATIADVEVARAQWAEDFVDQCIERNLEAVAITDHHEMVMVPYVQDAIAARKQQDPTFDLWLFPGMELTCRHGIQCLIIFDVELGDDWRREAQSRLGIVVASLNDKGKQGPAVTQLPHNYPQIAEILDAVPQLKGRYIVLPNVSDGGSYTALTKGSHADFRAMPYIGGYLDSGQSIETIGAKARRRLSGDDPSWGSRYIYPLPTSDAREATYAKLGSNNCWIKLAAPTAEAIRQAFLSYKSRISIEVPSITNLAVKSITVHGSTILAENSVELSPELNSFIGGRGSGKSTLLEYVAFGLGRSCYDIAKADYSGTGRLSDVIADTLIATGATLELAVVQDGATFYIRRSGATSYNPKITYPDGSSQVLSLKELRSLFPAVVYSQGELSEIGKQAGKRAQLSDLLQFVDPEFKREDERLNSEIESAKLAVRKALQSLSSAWAQEAQIHKLTTARTSLEQRITALQKTLPELPSDDRQHVEKYDRLSDLDGKRQLADKQAQSVMDQLGELWRTSRQPVDLTSPLPEAAALQSAYGSFNASFASGIEALGRELATHRDAVVAAGADVTNALAAAKVERDKALEKLTAHRSATAQITKLQEELQALQAQKGELDATRTSGESRFADLTAAIDILKRAVSDRAAKTKEWADKIETLSGKRIEAKLNEDKNWSEIFDAVDVLAAKTGSQSDTRHQRTAENLEQDGPWAFLDALRADCLTAIRWKQMSSGGGGERPSCQVVSDAIGATDRMLSAFLDVIDLARVEAVATAVPKPDITLFYCDEDRKIAFEKASEGQRAAALLFMLLEQPGGPLIVDQPEGDLDNKIVSELAEKLHSAKQHRQILFASHNANIVVNGSSELVLGMDVTADAKRAVGCCGAIDRDDVCRKITETMEGGEKAFRDRKAKYGY
jgi:chromosome segregation protein